MQKLLAAILTFVVVCGQPLRAQSAFGGIQLLSGYSAKRTSAVDAEAWTIEGKDGLKINFEAGPSEGSWADPDERQKYAWYREQTIHGIRVRFALVRLGLKTQWESSDDSRGLPAGNILLVTYLLSGKKSSRTANFSTKIANQDELADVLLMVTTFDPSKGRF